MEIEQRNSKGIKPLDRAIALDRLGPATWAMAEDKPQIQLVLLNKVLEDGNTLYRQARLEEAALRYRYGLRKVRSLYYWPDPV